MIKSKWLIRTILVLVLIWSFPDAKAFYAGRRTAESIVILTNDLHRGGGTGFELQYGKRQFTVTNDHVCGIATEDGTMMAHSPFLDTPVRVHVLARSSYTDLCILEPIKELPALKLRLGDLKKGDKVAIWGHPLLHPLKTTYGRVLVASHFIDVVMGTVFTKADAKQCQGHKNYIREGWFGLPFCFEHVRAQWVSARIQPGSSGSPMLDEKGRVAGVAFAGVQSDHPDGGYGEVIPWASLYIFLANYTQVYVGLTN